MDASSAMMLPQVARRNGNNQRSNGLFPQLECPLRSPTPGFASPSTSGFSSITDKEGCARHGASQDVASHDGTSKDVMLWLGHLDDATPACICRRAHHFMVHSIAQRNRGRFSPQSWPRSSARWRRIRSELEVLCSSSVGPRLVITPALTQRLEKGRAISSSRDREPVGDRAINRGAFEVSCFSRSKGRSGMRPPAKIFVCFHRPAITRGEPASSHADARCELPSEFQGIGEPGGQRRRSFRKCSPGRTIVTSSLRRAASRRGKESGIAGNEAKLHSSATSSSAAGVGRRRDPPRCDVRMNSTR